MIILKVTSIWENTKKKNVVFLLALYIYIGMIQRFPWALIEALRTSKLWSSMHLSTISPSRLWAWTSCASILRLWRRSDAWMLSSFSTSSIGVRMLLSPLLSPSLHFSITYIYIYNCTYLVHKILNGIYLKGIRKGNYIFFKKLKIKN